MSPHDRSISQNISSWPNHITKCLFMSSAYHKMSPRDLSISQNVSSWPKLVRSTQSVYLPCLGHYVSFFGVREGHFGKGRGQEEVSHGKCHNFWSIAPIWTKPDFSETSLQGLQFCGLRIQNRLFSGEIWRFKVFWVVFGVEKRLEMEQKETFF